MQHLTLPGRVRVMPHLAKQQEAQAAAASGQPLALLRLALNMESCATETEMNSNFYASLDRGYTPINECLWKYKGIVSLVGAGPSLEETYKDLKGDVLAINSAIGFLLEKGITPKFAMLWDCAEIVEKFAIPNKDITYLVASRCHPKVFDRLKDCRVYVWHAAGDYNIREIMSKPEVIAKQKFSEPLINGGSAGITRGIYLANNLGYNHIHIYGGDSSYKDDKTHVRGSLVPEKDMMVSIGMDPAIMFRTTPEWCCQIEEYKIIFTLFTQHKFNKLEVHGDGMLKTMHDILVAQKKHMGKKRFIKHVEKQYKERADFNKAVETSKAVNV